MHKNNTYQRHKKRSFCRRNKGFLLSIQKKPPYLIQAHFMPINANIEGRFSISTIKKHQNNCKNHLLSRKNYAKRTIFHNFANKSPITCCAIGVSFDFLCMLQPCNCNKTLYEVPTLICAGAMEAAYYQRKQKQ